MVGVVEVGLVVVMEVEVGLVVVMVVVVVHFSPHCIFHQTIYSVTATQSPTLNKPNLE